MDEGAASTTTPGEAAQLAVAVLDAEAEREAQQAAAQEEVLFANDLLPGVGEEEVSLGQAVRIGGVSTFVVLMLLPLVRRARVGDPVGARAGHPPRVRHQQRHDRVHRGGVGRVPRARRAADGLARRPLPRGRRSSAGPASRSPAFLALCGCGDQRVHAVLGAVRRRHRQGEHHPGARVADRRHLSDRHPRAHRRVAGDGRRAASACSARSSSPASPRWPAATTAGAGRSSSSASRSRSSRSSRSLQEPPRGQFEKQDVLGEVIEDEQPAPISMEAAFARLRQIRTLRTVLVALLRRWASGCSPPRCSPTSSWRTTTAPTPSTGACSAPSAASACCSCCPSSGSTSTGLYRATRRAALRLVGLLILPAALLTPIQFFMPNVIAVHDPAASRRLSCCRSAFTMVGPVLQSVVPYRLRGMGAALGSIYIFFIGATGGALLVRAPHRRVRHRAPR